MERNITVACLVLIIGLNGLFIAMVSPLAALHYFVAISFGLPLMYKLGKES